MRRRRLSRYIKPTALYMGELTTNDCYASAYYLYRISEMLSGCEEMFEYQVKLFLKLASRMKCTQAISDYLEKMVEKAEKGGKFTRLLFPDDVSTKSLIYFDFSTIPFVYEEDKDIDRNIPGDFDDHEKINQTIVNLYRCLYVDN